MTPRCPVCETELTLVCYIPEALTRLPFPFRCTGCLELLQIRPSDQGMTTHRFPMGKIEKPSFEKRQDKKADQAG